MSEEERVEALWSRVPYHAFAREIAPAAADLVETAGIDGDDDVLDVACGTGNVAITAAKRGADVTGIDLNDDMLSWGEDNADLIDDDVEFRRGNATDLPVGDDQYDVVLPAFGHHLTSDPVTATEELVRVTKLGGTVAFASYALDGVVGAAYRALTEHHPEGERVVKPFYWGDEEFVRDRFVDLFTELEFDRGSVKMHGLSGTDMVEYTLEISGAIRTAYEQTSRQEQLYEDWVRIAKNNLEGNLYPVDYLLVSATV
ncbi:MAG: class I SAM-dependent methyltransferase [Halolamina sp.]